jgi:GT2 family glycosyltransferase/SAM-dependent methyltransferase/glycosyltransferase involved in cell wall biosynthesis
MDGRKMSDMANNSFCIKAGYQARTRPEYYADEGPSNVVWQPDVYPLAAFLARRYGCTHIIDVGCGHARKLSALYPEFNIIGVDFGGNLEFCRAHYPFGQWIDADFETCRDLPIDPAMLQKSVVINSDVVEHLVDPSALLALLGKLLGHARVALISTPERDLTRGLGDPGPPANPCHMREWNLNEFDQLLRQTDLTPAYSGLTYSNNHERALKTILAVVANQQWDADAVAQLREASAAWLAQSPTAPVTHDEALRRDLARIQLEMGQASDQAASQSPLVSVIIPTFNRPDMLGDAIRSVLNQSYKNIEIIVVNDAGADVGGLVNWFGQDANITYVRHGQNRGLAAARNSGIKLAQGDIIAYLDDDDIYRQDHLATVVEAIATAGADIVYTDAEYVQEQWENGRRTEIGRTTPYANIPYTKERLHIHNFIPVNSWVHRRACLNTTGLFDETLDNHEDWDLLLRLARAFDLRHLPKVTVQVHQRVESDNMLRRERPKFYDTYQLIYARYDDFGNSNIAAGRCQLLAQLQQQGDSALTAIHGTQVGKAEAQAQQEYLTWRFKHSLQEIDAQLFAERMTLRWQTRPVFQIIVMLEPGQAPLLANTLDSLAAQMYADWRLAVIAPFAAPDPVFGEVSVLRWMVADSEVARVAALNTLLAQDKVDWVLRVPPGAKLEPHALLSCGDYVNLKPEWRLIYCDDDVIGADGQYREPRFKPEFNLDLLRSMDYIGPCFFHAQALRESGGYAAGRAAGYDATLRLLDHCGAGAIGHVSDMLIHLPATATASSDPDAMQAVRAHLARTAVPGEVTDGFSPGTQRVVYQRLDDPLVSILIPTKDKLEFFQPCIESVLHKTAYANYEVLVIDNQSSDPDVLVLYQELETRYPGKVRILPYGEEFNFSAINNYAASQARGEYLLLLNNDTQVVQPEWLERLLAYGQRSDVGAVGARLVYPETAKLQHAGVVLGMSGIADHPFNGMPITEPGYMNRALVDQNYSAVTAACMLVRKSVYQQVGGMDKEQLKVLFNDVDLCLKIGQAGYRIVWTPFSTVVHYGSTSIKAESMDLMKLALNNERAKREQATMLERWLPKLANDPAYNRHLSLTKTGYGVEDVVVIDWDTAFHDRPRILGVPLVGGSGEYRICAPFRALGNAAKAKCDVVEPLKYNEARLLSLPELARADPDTLVVHAAISDVHIAMLEMYKRFHPSLRVFTLDDLVTNVPEKSPFYKHSFRDAKLRLRKALSFCDRAVVSTQPLVEMCHGMIDDIRLIPNYLEKTRWGGLQSVRSQGRKPRVGWAGAQQHHGDLALIVDLVKATAQEVDWVFFGMCLEELKPYIKEEHPFVLDFDAYPKKLASLNLDIAVAPLEAHPFNEAKSNLRILEYGALGLPVICSDIYPYQNAPVKRVSNDPQAWATALRERIDDLDAAGVEGDCLRQWVHKHYMLEDHLDEWFSALTR